MFSYYYKTIDRRGHKITLEKKVYDKLSQDGYNLILVTHENKPSSVQLVRKGKYIGTLKALYDVVGFKDGNVCNFKRSNLIYKA